MNLQWRGGYFYRWDIRRDRNPQKNDIQYIFFLDITATKALLNEQHAILNSRVSGIAKQKNCYFIWANSALNKFLAVVYLEGQLLLPNRHP